MPISQRSPDPWTTGEPPAMTPRSDSNGTSDSASPESHADRRTDAEPTARTPEDLICRHQRGVWRYLRMLGCDVATADDLTQETFLRVLRHESFVQHNDTATAGYLRRTAYNLLVSQHRKLGRMHCLAEASVLDEQWDRWAGKDLSGDLAVDLLKECLETLSERARLALRMRFEQEVSRAEIGHALGITDHGARNLMQRAKAQLRRCVQEKLRQAETQ